MALEYPFELPATLFHSIGMPITTRIDRDTLRHFAKALMTISGADNRLSVWERGWLTAYLAAYGADDDLLRELDDFDYRNQNVNTYLTPLLEGKYHRWVRRSLLQGAIRMARADTMSPEEAQSIHRVGAMLGMSKSTVNEVVSLVEMFDRVTSTNTILLSIAQKEDADDYLETQQMEAAQQTSWDDDEAPTIPNQEVTLPDDELLQRNMETFARALLYVAAADGEVSEQEIEFFRAYMHTWGATKAQVDTLLTLDPHTITAEAVVENANNLSWGLKALTSVAIRTAGADGLTTEEEEAILKIYRLTNRSVMHYYAAKGLEEVREMALDRLNTIFAAHLGPA